MKKFYITLLLAAVSFTAMAQQEEGTIVSTKSEAQTAVSTASTAEAISAEKSADVADDVSTEVTDSVAAQTPNEARKHRGVTTDDVFVPRGQWIFGGSASYTAHRHKDFKFLVIDNINTEGYTLSVKPMIAYAPYKNMAVGIRFGYGRSLLALDGASVGIADVSLELDMLHQIKHSFTGTLFWRPYIPLGHTNRFALFAEVQFNFTAAQSKIVSQNGMVGNYPSYSGSFAEKFGASVGVQPGLMAFVTNNTALEVSIGVFSIGYGQTDQVRNQIDAGSFNSSNMSFMVDFLSIGFGVSFYL